MSSVSVRSYAYGITALLSVSVLGYCVWFDHQRRHSPEFRRKLERQKQSVARANKAQAQRARTASADNLRRALEAIEDEPLPGGSPEEKENYFLEQVAIGEQLVAKGPDFYVPAAVQFYKALRVYPAPHELIMIYQKTQPPAVFSLIMDCLSKTGGPSARGRSSEGAIIEEIGDASTPSSPARSKKNSSASSSDASPNGNYVKVTATGD